jgi:hypothetical protein
MCKHIKSYMIFLIMFSAVNAFSAELIASADFEDGAIPNSNGWGFGTQPGGELVISTDTNANFLGSTGSLRASYPKATGGLYVWGGYDLAALNTREVYIEFSAKLPAAKQGLKFLKIFGQREAGRGYANTTIALVSDPGNQGGITQISFGNGTSLDNDTQNVINLNGRYPEWIGRSHKVAAVVDTPQMADWSAKNWGNDWHKFRVRVKFNSGDTEANQKPDGAYYLEIDGKVYVDARNIYNRHYLNRPIQKVAFFDWAQNGTEAFDVMLDNIVISKDGFLTSPQPPRNPQIISN